MATYQGERYIGQQLDSILSQLGEEDELNIVDDGSKDNTRGIIRGYGDARIRLVESERNRGALLAFESAVRMASGGIIFLSDQDDEWLPRKAETVLDIFATRPDVNLVASDAELMDENGNPIQGSYYERRGGFSSSFWANLIRCRFLGATMAFRSSLLPGVLPFPREYDVLHDIWIGMRNTLTGGKSYFIHEPLIRYRRHSANVSRPQSGLRKARIRMDLLLALGAYKIRRHRVD